MLLDAMNAQIGQEEDGWIPWTGRLSAAFHTILRGRYGTDLPRKVDWFFEWVGRQCRRADTVPYVFEVVLKRSVVFRVLPETIILPPMSRCTNLRVRTLPLGGKIRFLDNPSPARTEALTVISRRIKEIQVPDAWIGAWVYRHDESFLEEVRNTDPGWNLRVWSETTTFGGMILDSEGAAKAAPKVSESGAENYVTGHPAGCGENDIWYGRIVRPL